MSKRPFVITFCLLVILLGVYLVWLEGPSVILEHGTFNSLVYLLLFALFIFVPIAPVIAAIMELRQHHIKKAIALFIVAGMPVVCYWYVLSNLVPIEPARNVSTRVPLYTNMLTKKCKYLESKTEVRWFYSVGCEDEAGIQTTIEYFSAHPYSPDRCKVNVKYQSAGDQAFCANKDNEVHSIKTTPQTDNNDTENVSVNKITDILLRSA